MDISNLVEHYATMLHPVLDAQLRLFVATTVAGVVSKFVKKIIATILKTVAIILGVLFVLSFIA